MKEIKRNFRILIKTVFKISFNVSFKRDFDVFERNFRFMYQSIF